MPFSDTLFPPKLIDHFLFFLLNFLLLTDISCHKPFFDILFTFYAVKKNVVYPQDCVCMKVFNSFLQFMYVTLIRGWIFCGASVLSVVFKTRREGLQQKHGVWDTAPSKKNITAVVCHQLSEQKIF